METLMIPPPPRPGAPPPAPPVNVSGKPLGFDIYQSNGPAVVTVADFQALKRVGKIFGIHKVAQGGVDAHFDDRYPLIRQAGLIRGCYDFFAPQSVDPQVTLLVNHVQRLTPGDLGPALDLEDGSGALNAKYHYSTGVPASGGKPAKTALQCRQDLLNDVMAWLNGVEKQLGRIPIVYTGVIWREQFSAANFPNLPDMNVYPLMTAHPQFAGPNPGATGEVLRGWSDYAIWQYAENKKAGAQGAQQWGVNPYLELGTATFDGIDYDAYNGTIWGLRGLADIGRPGVALNGTDPHIAHSEIDGHIHLIARPSGWTDTDLNTSGSLVAGGEDPVLMSAGGALFLYFRSEGHLIEAVLASGSSNWEADQIEEATLIHDPRVALDGDKRYAVYWADDDDWHLMTFDGSWTGSGGILRASNLGASTGQPAVYVTGGVPHVVGRVDLDGDLLDVWQEGGNWRHDNVSELARDLAPAMPAATYSPCAYETSGGVGIVFRGVGGHLWLVNRSDNSPTDLTATTQAPVATGHPSCFVFQDKPHIVFRGVDRLVHEIWLESGSWHLQQVCDATAAADPVATTDGTLAMVAFRGSDGTIYASQFDGTGWSCGQTATVTIPTPTPTPIATPTPHPTPTPTPHPTPTPTPTPQPTPTPTPTPIATGPMPTPTPGSGVATAVFPSPDATFPQLPRATPAAASSPAPAPAPAPTVSRSGNTAGIVGLVGLAALAGMVATAAMVAIVAIAKDED